jgi:hypothetical protein
MIREASRTAGLDARWGVWRDASSPARFAALTAPKLEATERDFVEEYFPSVTRPASESCALLPPALFLRVVICGFLVRLVKRALQKA